MEAVVFRTPLGWAGVAATGQGVCKVVLPKKNKPAVGKELKSSKCGAGCGKTAGAVKLVTLKKTVKLLQKYFSGARVTFDAPLDWRHHTPFRQAVWRAAAGIPFGATRSYAWIAKKIKKPLAARAVGAALGANPIPIIIPCHRVVGSSGALTGYAGGLGMKRMLLELESKRCETK